jgi:hypothetical protein
MGLAHKLNAKLKANYHEKQKKLFASLPRLDRLPLLTRYLIYTIASRPAPFVMTNTHAWLSDGQGDYELLSVENANLFEQPEEAKIINFRVPLTSDDCRA